MLREFLGRPQKVLSRGYLFQRVWGGREPLGSRSVDNVVVGLRRHLEGAPFSGVVLRSVRGRGYCLQKFPMEEHGGMEGDYGEEF